MLRHLRVLGLFILAANCSQRDLQSDLHPDTRATADALADSLYRDGITRMTVLLGDPNLAQAWTVAENTATIVLNGAHTHQPEVNFTSGYGDNLTVIRQGRGLFTGMPADLFSTANPNILVTDTAEWNRLSQTNAFASGELRSVNSAQRQQAQQIVNESNLRSGIGRQNFFLLLSQDRVSEIVKLVQTGIIDHLDIRLIEGANQDAATMMNLLERLRITRDIAPQNFPQDVKVGLYLSPQSTTDRAASNFLLLNESLPTNLGFAEIRAFVPDSEGVFDEKPLEDAAVNEIKNAVKAERAATSYHRVVLEGNTRPTVLGRISNRIMDVRFLNNVSDFGFTSAQIRWSDGRVASVATTSQGNAVVMSERVLTPNFTLRLSVMNQVTKTLQTIEIPGSTLEQAGVAVNPESQLPIEMEGFVREMAQATQQANIRATIASSFGEEHVNAAISDAVVKGIAANDRPVAEIVREPSAIANRYSVHSESRPLTAEAVEEKLEEIRPTLERIATRTATLQRSWFRDLKERIFRRGR